MREARRRTGGSANDLSLSFNQRSATGLGDGDAPERRARDNGTDGIFDVVVYYAFDADYNVVAIADGQGAVYERCRYDPYGKVRIWNQNNTELVSGGVPYSGLKNEIMFQGRERDAETGLYHWHGRMYHPTLGRYMQRDPIGYGDGLSLYEYCGSGPVDAVDPFGLVWDGTECPLRTLEYIPERDGPSIRLRILHSRSLMVRRPIVRMAPTHSTGKRWKAGCVNATERLNSSGCAAHDILIVVASLPI